MREFHIQNIFDALNMSGEGVNGHLKLKCLQLQNRVLAMAHSGDIVAVSSDCPQDFCNYMMGLKAVKDITFLKIKVDTDLRSYFDSSTLFDLIDKNPLAEELKREKPLLLPYIHSSAFYKAARQSNWFIRDNIWDAITNKNIVELMNNKRILVNECKRFGLPMPETWILKKDKFQSEILLLLDQTPKLFIRQSQSGGGLGNTTVMKIGTQYYMNEVSEHPLSLSEFKQYLTLFVRMSYSKSFIVSKLLDLYASPGTLFYASDTSVKIVAHTSQILNAKHMFVGFTYPIQDENIIKHFPDIEYYTKILIEPWRQQGFRGYGNIDWMIDNKGNIFIAERNARQTAVVAPLTLLSSFVKESKTRPMRIPSNLTVITKDSLHLSELHDFTTIKRLLEQSNLLLTKSSEKLEGIVITIPPSPETAPNQVGIMALGDNLKRAFHIFDNALRLLEQEREKLLFPIFSPL